MQEQIEKIIEEHEELAYAYQGVVQPMGNEDFGEGYWKGIKYSKDFITKAYQSGREDEMAKMKEELNHKMKKFTDGFAHPKDCGICLSTLTNNKDEKAI